MLKRILTAADVCELRMFYARYPFDDESNHWHPNAILMAELHNRLLGGAGAQPKSPIDYLPRMKAASEEGPAETPQPKNPPSKRNTKKQLKRIAKQKGW